MEIDKQLYSHPQAIAARLEGAGTPFALAPSHESSGGLMALNEIERAIAKLEAAIRECDRLLAHRPVVPAVDEGDAALDQLFCLLENDDRLDDPADGPRGRHGIPETHRQSLRQ